MRASLPRRLGRSWLAALIFAVLIAALYALLSQPGKGERLSDFMKAYYAAGDALLHGGAAALWPLIQTADFVNIPAVAWLFVPFAALGPGFAKLAFTGLGLVAAAAAGALLAREAPPARRPVIFMLFVASGPLWYSVLVGNISHVVLLVLLCALLSLRSGRPYVAGLLLGTAAVLKPMFLLFGVYFLLRRNWRVALGGASVIAAAVLLSIGLFGMDYTIGWYQQCIATFATQPMGAANNQSIDGFLLRLWTGTALLRDWQPHVLPTGARAIKDIFVIILFTMTIMTLWKNRMAQANYLCAGLCAEDYLEYCLILTICIILSPISWTHYYTMLLIVFGIYVAGRLPHLSDRISRWLITGSIVLCSIPVRIPLVEPAFAGIVSSRTVDSCWFIGGLLLLAALFRGALLSPVAPATQRHITSLLGKPALPTEAGRAEGEAFGIQSFSASGSGAGRPQRARAEP
jgi:hypothetical protein